MTTHQQIAPFEVYSVATEADREGGETTEALASGQGNYPALEPLRETTDTDDMAAGAVMAQACKQAALLLENYIEEVPPPAQRHSQGTRYITLDEAAATPLPRRSPVKRRLRSHNDEDRLVLSRLLMHVGQPVPFNTIKSWLGDPTQRPITLRAGRAVRKLADHPLIGGILSSRRTGRNTEYWIDEPVADAAIDTTREAAVPTRRVASLLEIATLFHSTPLTYGRAAEGWHVAYQGRSLGLTTVEIQVVAAVRGWPGGAGFGDLLRSLNAQGTSMDAGTLAQTLDGIGAKFAARGVPGWFDAPLTGGRGRIERYIDFWNDPAKVAAPPSTDERGARI